MTPVCLLVLGFATLPLLAAEGTAKSPTDATRIQGAWKIVSGEEEGKAQDVPPGLSWTFQGNTLIVRIDGKLAGAATFKLKEAGPAKHMDLTAIPPDPRMGPELRPGAEIEKSPVFAIYKLSGDTLTICAAKPGKPRPTAFATRKGDPCALVLLRRMPAEDSRPGRQPKP